MSLTRATSDATAAEGAPADLHSQSPARNAADPSIRDAALLAAVGLGAMTDVVPAGMGDAPCPTAVATAAAARVPAGGASDGTSEATLALALLRALPEPVFLMDPDGRVTFMNPGGVAHLSLGGRGPMRNWSDLWPEASEAVLRDLMQQAREGESNEVRLPGLAMDGRVTLWRISFVPLEDSQGMVTKILCILRET